MTIQDLYTNPQMQGGVAPAAAAGATSLFIDGKPALTANDSIGPVTDKALPIPNGLFHDNQPLLLLNGPTTTGGTLLAPNRTPTVLG